MRRNPRPGPPRSLIARRSPLSPRAPAPAVPFLALVITFVACGPILVFYIVAVTKQCWDFVATVTFLHWVLTCLVTLSFPLNWVWWVAFLPCGLLMSTGSELCCYYLRDMREIQLDN